MLKYGTKVIKIFINFVMLPECPRDYLLKYFFSLLTMLIAKTCKYFFVYNGSNILI